MTFVPNEEQTAFQKAVREFLAARLPESSLRAHTESELGYDENLWRDLARLGVQGLIIPQRYGGSDASWLELGLALEEAGRALLGAPVLATALATAVLLDTADDAACQRHLPAIADGSTSGTVAFPPTMDDASGPVETLSAHGENGHWRLSGRASYVIDGVGAHLLIVFADTGDGPGVFTVDGNAAGLRRTPLRTIDLTRRQAQLDFNAVDAARLGGTHEAGRALAHVADLAAVGLALEAVGGMRQLVGQAAAYARTRFQFGRPIGSFQAVKHRCADMLINTELAVSVAYEALSVAVESPGELPAAASLAKAYAADAYFSVAWDNIMVHGGIGFTWEHPAHLYYRRAKSDQLLLGTPTRHRARLLDRLGISFIDK